MEPAEVDGFVANHVAVEYGQKHCGDEETPDEFLHPEPPLYYKSRKETEHPEKGDALDVRLFYQALFFLPVFFHISHKPALSSLRVCA